MLIQLITKFFQRPSSYQLRRERFSAPTATMPAAPSPHNHVTHIPAPETLGKVYEGVPGQSAEQAARPQLHVIPDDANVTDIWQWAQKRGREVPEQNLRTRIADMNRRSHGMPQNRQAPLDPSKAI